MNIDQALHTFIAESRELLADMETALLAVEQTDERGELLNAIFRAAHTIKGSAGLFNLEHIVAFTHVVESVLDRVRGGKLTIDINVITILGGKTARRKHGAGETDQGDPRGRHQQGLEMLCEQLQRARR